MHCSPVGLEAWNLVCTFIYVLSYSVGPEMTLAILGVSPGLCWLYMLYYYPTVYIQSNCLFFATSWVTELFYWPVNIFYHWLALYHGLLLKHTGTYRHARQRCMYGSSALCNIASGRPQHLGVIVWTIRHTGMKQQCKYHLLICPDKQTFYA